jgi:hypothetical protein
MSPPSALLNSLNELNGITQRFSTPTRAVSETRNPVAALLRYERERRPVMNDIILRNRNLGPEAAMQLAEERAPAGFERINDVISRNELDAIVTSFATAAGLDVKTVNTRPSYVRRDSLS